MNGMEYSVLTGEESFGTHGVGVKIMIATTGPLPDSDDYDHPLKVAAWKAREAIKQELEALAYAADPGAQARAARDRHELLALFSGHSIFAEPIPNGYCSRACCRHLPWFKVTTHIGRFTIGWRKRVINIDWTETIVQRSAEELFPDESVTKSERHIHAWSLEDAQRYINTIRAAA